MAYTPTPRPPTGIPAAPLIMVSGLPKAGKSLTAYKIGLSPQIATTWVIDLGEGSADEYGQAANYHVLDWGRSWADLQDTIRWCVAQPVPSGQLNAVIIDSGTELWDGLKIRADKRARNSKKNREALAKDPDHEVDVSMPFWNDAKDTWARVISPLKLAGHLVGVVIVRSDVVNEVANGAPTQRKVTSYQCEKTLPSIVTAHVEVRADHTARLIEVRSLHLSVAGQGMVLDQANPLGDLLARLAPTGGFAAPDVSVPVDDERDAPDYERVTAEQAEALRQAINQAPEDVRPGLRQAFASEFGRPADVPAGRLADATVWVEGRVSRLTAPDDAPAALFAEDAA